MIYDHLLHSFHWIFCIGESLVTLYVDWSLLSCQKPVHGGWHRLHVDLKQDTINSRANNTVV